MRHGFLLIDKPIGPTSHDVVAQVRRALHEPKIGHLGTLDPLASGLLVLAVGAKALKVVEFFGALQKEYVAEIRCGATSTTYDAEGVIEEQPRKAGWEPPVDASRIQTLIDDHFVGCIRQVPPVYSAVHVGGERAYRKAMRGEHVELKAREVTIQHCTVIGYDFPCMSLRVRCDSGTYIRSLAHDLGQKLRCGAYLTSLRRTMVGDWSLEKARSADVASFGDVVPLKEILRCFPGTEVTESQKVDLLCGRSIFGACHDRQPFVAWFCGLPIAFLEPSKQAAGMLKPRKVL